MQAKQVAAAIRLSTTTDQDASGGEAAPFGQLLRSHRRRAGLTQAALEGLSTVSARAIRNLESGQAHGRTQTLELLADGLGLAGLARETFLQAGRRLPDEPSPGTDLDPAPPAALDSLVGRDTEVRAMVYTLESGEHRTTSVCGLGGVGKTRIVMEIARRLHHQRKWPVVWVPVGIDELPSSSAPLAHDFRSLFDSPTSARHRLCRVIAEHDALVVLDGVDELTAASGDTLRELLSRCPGLRIICTSRAPLPTSIAHSNIVEPLPVPATGSATGSVTTLATVPSVRVFANHLAASQPGWALTMNDASAVAKLCQRLDGLPGALHLAADRAAFLGIHAVAELPPADLLRLGRPEGPSTNLATTIESSYRLLPEPDQADLRLLIGLRSPWTIDDAAAVLRRSRTGAVDTLVVLARLGLVRRFRGHDATRFEVLQLVRAFLQVTESPPAFQVLAA